MYLNGKEKFAEPDSKFMLLNRPTNEARASKNEWANPSFVAAYPGLRNGNVCLSLQSKVAPLVMVLVDLGSHSSSQKTLYKKSIFLRFLRNQ